MADPVVRQPRVSVTDPTTGGPTPPRIIDPLYEPILQPDLDVPPRELDPNEERVNVVHPRYGMVSVPRSTLEEAYSKGWRLESEAENKERYLEQKYGANTAENLIGTAAAAFNRGVTGGLSDLIERGLSGEEAVERLSQQRARHPTLSTGLELTGALAPAAFTGGAGAAAGGTRAGLGAAAAATPSGAIMRAGAYAAESAAASAAELPAVARALAPVVASGATEGALFGAGQGLTEAVLSEDPLTAEKIVSAMGSGMLYGGEVGVAFGFGGAMLDRAAAGARDLVQGRLAAREAAAAAKAEAGVNIEAFEDVAALQRKADMPALKNLRKSESDVLAEQRVAEKNALRADEEKELARLKKEHIDEKTAVAREITGFNAQANEVWIPSTNRQTVAAWGKNRKPLLRMGDDVEGLEQNVAPMGKHMRALRSALQDTARENADMAAIARMDAEHAREIASALRKAPEAAAVTGGESLSWIEFLKGRMGPAMKAAGGDHGIAIRRLSEEFKAHKAGAAPTSTASTSEILLEGKAARTYEGYFHKEMTRGNVPVPREDAEKFMASLSEGRVMAERQKNLEMANALLGRTERIADRVRALGTVNEPYVYASPRLSEIRAAKEDIGMRRMASPRLDAIEAAIDNLQHAKPPGIVKGLAQATIGGAAYTLGTALGLSPTLAGVLGGAAGLSAGNVALNTLRGRLASGAARTGKALATAMDTFVAVEQQATRAAPIIASKILNQARFAPPELMRGVEDRKPKTKDVRLAGFWARERELRAQTTPGADGREQLRPEAARALHEKLAGVWALSPKLGDHMEGVAARRLTFLADKLPRRPDWSAMPGMAPDTWRPSDAEVAKFARYVAATEGMLGIVDRLNEGTMTPEDAEALRVVYPEALADIQMGLVSRMAALRQALPYKRRLTYSILFGVPVDPAMRPEIVALLQSNFESEPGTEGGIQQPKPSPQFGSVTKTPATRAQEAAG